MNKPRTAMNEVALPEMTSNAMARRYLEAKRRFWGKTPEPIVKLPDPIKKRRAQERALKLAKQRQNVEDTPFTIFPSDQREDIAEILTKHDKTWADIFRPSAERPVVQCRHELWHMLIEKYGWNYFNLGDVFGRDRNTIRHGHKRWKTNLHKKKMLELEQELCNNSFEAN